MGDVKLGQLLTRTQPRDLGFGPMGLSGRWAAMRIKCSSGYIIGLATFRLLFPSHCGPFASNLEQFVNLLCAQVNSASYPQLDGK